MRPPRLTKGSGGRSPERILDLVTLYGNTSENVMQMLSSKNPKRRRIEALNAERREILGCGSAYAQEVAAKEYPFLPEDGCDKWVKIIRYPQIGGGKVIIFKAGNPHLPREKGRQLAEAYTEEERAAARFSQSISRTKRRIFEIAACNKWEWFFTGTLDGEKCDRCDLNGTFKHLSQFIRDFRKTHDGENIAYLIVPEQHKDGAWHFHGLINGITEAEMHKFSLSEKIPVRIKRTIQGGTDVFSWTAYSERFGYSTMTRVKNENAVACYVTKYITKDIVQAHSERPKGEHLYYASRGLRKPETIAESYPETSYAPGYDYENDYVCIRPFTTDEEMNMIIERYGIRRCET